MSNQPNMGIISRIHPINKDEEKRKFFFDTNYNPQFVYEDPATPAELALFGKVSTEYMDTAKRIIDDVIKTWKTESAYLLEAEGEIISREDAAAQITQYLKDQELDQVVTVRYTHKLLSRTSIDGLTMNVRLPIEYRKLSFQGTLNHEIGTHVLRRLNDRNQPWTGEREKYEMRPYLETEEGLAALHSYISSKEKHIWLQALMYCAAQMAATMSFAQLYEALRPYQDDRERRWNLCLRMKRGMTDTSLPGVFAKDQVYFKGIIKMLQWLEANEYDITPLYYGKIDIRDVSKAQSLNPKYEPILPRFFVDNKAHYKAMIQEIQKRNAL